MRDSQYESEKLANAILVQYTTFHEFIPTLQVPYEYFRKDKNIFLVIATIFVYYY